VEGGISQTSAAQPVLGPVSQKVVNRKLGHTTVFTIYDRFTKLADFRYTTFFGRKLPTGSEQS